MAAPKAFGRMTSREQREKDSRPRFPAIGDAERVAEQAARRLENRRRKRLRLMGAEK